MQKRFSWLPVFIRNCNPADELCDWNTGYGTLRCNPVNSCPGAAPGASDADRGYPNHVWSSGYEGSNYYNSYLNNGTLSAPYLVVPTYPFSVRCVLDLEYSNFKKIGRHIQTDEFIYTRTYQIQTSFCNHHTRAGAV